MREKENKGEISCKSLIMENLTDDKTKETKRRKTKNLNQLSYNATQNSGGKV